MCLCEEYVCTFKDLIFLHCLNCRGIGVDHIQDYLFESLIKFLLNLHIDKYYLVSIASEHNIIPQL